MQEREFLEKASGSGFLAISAHSGIPASSQERVRQNTKGTVSVDNRITISKDPIFDTLVAPGSQLDLIATGFGFTEGITWVQDGTSGYLLFSDIPANVIYRLVPGRKPEIYLEKTGYQNNDVWRVGMRFNNGKPEGDPAFEKFNMFGSNGLALDRQGRLVIAAWAGRSIVRLERNHTRTVVAERFEGKRFGGPNDVVVRNDGSIYFTDTFGGMLLGDKDPSKELAANAIYMIREGKVTRVVDDIANTNGLAFSPDEKVLYANGSIDNYIRRYDVLPDGTLTNSKMLCDLSQDKSPGITDGMKVDQFGNLWTTAPGGIWVISPQGKPLGVIKLPEAASNLVFGDREKKSLYISANGNIYKLKVNVAGCR